MDKLTKNILSGSKLELTNPEFNAILMDKIRVESKKRALFRNIKFYSLIFICIDIAVITLLNLTKIRFSEISSQLADCCRVFKNFYSNTGQLVFIYFSVLFVVILVINTISSVSYTKSRLG